MTMLLRSFLYLLILYDHLWRNSQAGLLPNVLPIILYNGEEDWDLPSNLNGLIVCNIPDRFIPSFEYFPIVEKNVPDEVLEGLHNLIAAVILLERQQNEEELVQALRRVVDFIRDEGIFEIRDLMIWMGKLFKAGLVPAEVQHLKDFGEARSMLSTLAEKMETKSKTSRLEGKIEGKIEDARPMMADGISLEQIIKYTGLSRDLLVKNLADTR